MHQHVYQFDKSVADFVSRLPVWIAPLMQFVTLIGQPLIVIPFAIMLAVYAYDAGKERIAIAFALTLCAGAGNSVLKMVFQRERPDTLYVQNMIIKSYSFPSGHAFIGAVFYGLIGYVLFRYAPQPWNGIGAIAMFLLAILIGVSRIFLGAHFPSDVLAGWLLGLLSLVIIIAVCKI
jgi:undecaprenyl-diphosphatase